MDSLIDLWAVLLSKIIEISYLGIINILLWHITLWIVVCALFLPIEIPPTVALAPCLVKILHTLAFTKEQRTFQRIQE